MNSITRISPSPDDTIHFITYGDKRFARSRKRVCKEAVATNWFRSVKGYSNDDLTLRFQKDFGPVLRMRRGGGYWIWKYDVILQRLSEINDGEFLVYVDSGCTVNSRGETRLRDYIQKLKSCEPSKHMISFQMEGLKEMCWTTKEIFEALGVPDDHPIRYSGQYHATVLIMRRCEAVLRVFEDCLRLIKSNPLIITDFYNKKNQIRSFRDNRHDQSILSVTLKKRNISIVMPDETWFSNFSSDAASKVPFQATRLQ